MNKIARENHERLNAFLKENRITVNEIQFWKHDFGHNLKNLTTGVVAPSFTRVYWYTVIGITENESIVVVNNKSKKKMYIKPEYYNTDSTYWYETNNFGMLVRIGLDPKDSLLQLSMWYLSQAVDNNNTGINN